jgi:hypothetical protein
MVANGAGDDIVHEIIHVARQNEYLALHREHRESKEQINSPGA